MGNKNSSQIDSKTTQLSYLQNNIEQEDSQWQLFMQENRCCCIKYRTKKRRRFIWQDNFIKNCKELRTYFYWTDDLVHSLLVNRFQRLAFVKEVQQLRFVNFDIINKKEKEILLTPSEVNDFKKNLKKSVLLSHGSITKSNKKEGNRVISLIPPLSTIEASMNNPKGQKQRQRQRDTAQFKYNDNSSRPINYAPTPTKNVRGATRIQNFRKSVIVDRRRSRQSLSSNRSKSALRQSLISFVDDTLSSVFRSEKEVTKQSAKNLQIFMRFSVILQKHLSIRSNPINIIIRTFKNQIYKKYGIGHQNKQINQQFTMDMIDNIKSFITLLSETIYEFYNLKKFEQNEGNFIANELVVNDQNLSTLITTILFKDQKFYGLIIDIIMQHNQKRQQKFQKALEKRGEFISPENLEIKDAYCLTVSTLKRHKLNQSIDSKLQDFNLQELDSQVGDQIPYKQSIQILRGISKSKSPVAKMKTIMQCSQAITQSISKFYTLHNMQIKQWVLDADQVLSIFCYIICNAKVPHLHSHLFLLQHFSTDNQLISVTGYFYSVLMCALQQVQKASQRISRSSENLQDNNEQF